MLELRRYGPKEVAKHEHDAPRLNAGDIPLELRLGERARRVAHDSDFAIVLNMGQAAAHASRATRAIAFEAKAPVELRVRQRSALRALERSADI
jgi:hypothetical protein